jgi:hypothetical protein
MVPLSNKEYVIKTLKEILLFIINLLLLSICIVIIAVGSTKLEVDWLGFIPFVYFIYFFTKDIPDKDEKIKQLEQNIKYYQHRLETYEATFDAIVKSKKGDK